MSTVTGVDAESAEQAKGVFERPDAAAEGAFQRPDAAAAGALWRPDAAAEGAFQRPGAAAEGALQRPGTAAAGAVEREVRLVDSDVHPSPRSFAELIEYLPDRWRKDPCLSRVEFDHSVYLPANQTGGPRADSFPADGSAAGSDPEMLERQLFVEAGVDIGILLPVAVPGMSNPEHEAALKSATNSWLADTWLGSYNREGRYRGSISVCAGLPELAVQEIERWAEHPDFVQVLIDPYLVDPLGKPQYRPIFAAAERHGLPVAVHINRTPGPVLLSPVGYPSYFAEFHPLYAMSYVTHFVSLIVEGAFERFESLKVVFVEGGVAWIAPMMWRLDNLYEELRAEVPWLRRRPSEYVADHVRATTQPLEETAKHADLCDHIAWIGSEDVVMFSSDYPHWDFDNPGEVLRRLTPEMQEHVMARNGIELYGLPETIRLGDA
ncbi:MAG TPA: amidohydrolase family protein [Solirubrobacteraceae bacterium]|jgi:predicted TIM-barrel fold metal-dependent hydrolase